MPGLIRPSRRGTAAGVLIAAAGLLALSSAQPTSAAFTDTGEATSGSFGTLAKLSTPTLSCSVLGVANVGFSWTAVSGATGYDFSITPTGGSTTTTRYGAGVTSTNRAGLVATGTVVVRAVHAYPSTTWYSNYSQPVSYTVAAVTLCS